MYQKKLMWLLCATILTSQPAFAKKAEDKGGSNKVASIVASDAKTSALKLERVIAEALKNSSQLKAFNSSVAVAKGEQQQAGAWSNPELGIEAENIAGGGNYQGFDSAEVTYGVTQELQIGGKISARENIAGKGSEIAELEYQAAKLDLVEDATVAYFEAVAAEESVRLASEQQELAEDVLKSVSARVGAAAAPQIQKSRAEVESYASSIAKDKSIRERSMAFKELEALMGGDLTISVVDSEDFYDVSKPNLKNSESALVTNPDIMKLNIMLEQSKARLDLEKANAIPDPSLSVGVRDFQDSGDQAFVVGVSIPIPIFDANSGNIEKASHEVIKNEFDNRQIMLNANVDLAKLVEKMESAYLQAETIKTEILPSAERAFQLAREGYGLGRFPYLEVLDAQRSLFGVKQQHIEAIVDFHTAKAKVERLTATHLKDIKNTGEDHAE